MSANVYLYNILTAIDANLQPINEKHRYKLSQFYHDIVYCVLYITRFCYRASTVIYNVTCVSMMVICSVLSVY